MTFTTSYQVRTDRRPLTFIGLADEQEADTDFSLLTRKLYAPTAFSNL